MPVKSSGFSVKTKGFCHLENITGQVGDAVRESGIKSGIACVAVTGSTAGISTLEYEPGLLEDIPELMERLAPSERSYKHDNTWHDGNGFSHARSFLLKTSLCVPFNDRNLMLGTWQQVVLADFDNKPRTRDVVVQIVGE